MKKLILLGLLMALGLSVAQPAWIEDQYLRADCMYAYTYVVGDDVIEDLCQDEGCEDEVDDMIEDAEDAWIGLHECGEDYSCIGEEFRNVARLMQQMRQALVWYGFQWAEGDPEDTIELLSYFAETNFELYVCHVEGEWPEGWPWENGD